MKTFSVVAIQTVTKIVEIEAASEEDALELVQERFEDFEEYFERDDYETVEFQIQGKAIYGVCKCCLDMDAELEVVQEPSGICTVCMEDKDLK